MTFQSLYIYLFLTQRDSEENIMTVGVMTNDERTTDWKQSDQSLSSPPTHFNLTGSLHTDVLEDKYGPIRVQLLHHDQDFRVVHLMDRESISRTFAITLFPAQEHSSSLAAISQKIKNGNPLGKSFRDSGYEVRKNVLKALIIQKPDWLNTSFCDPTPFAKARISEFLARKSSDSVEFYGTVLEIYPSMFRSAEISMIDKFQESPTVNNLLKHGFQVDQVWNGLANTHLHYRGEFRYIQALRESQQDMSNFSQRIDQVLSRNWSE
jgi:hypothetical protein